MQKIEEDNSHLPEKVEDINALEPEDLIAPVDDEEELEKKKARENRKEIEWDPTPGKMPFVLTKFMIIISFLYLTGGVLVCFDGFYSLYYINNPNLYSYALVLQLGKNVTPFYSLLPYDNKNDYTNQTIFQQKYKDKNVTENLIYQYVVYNKDRGGENSKRYFANCIIFGLFQMACSVLAFLIRKPHYRWKTDNLPMILVI
jgi:hypothetical protein